MQYFKVSSELQKRSVTIVKTVHSFELTDLKKSGIIYAKDSKYKGFVKDSIRRVNSRESFFLLSTKDTGQKVWHSKVRFVRSMTSKFYFNLGS